MTIKNASSGSNLSPVHIFEELLDEAVLLWPSPDDLAQVRITETSNATDMSLRTAALGSSSKKPTLTTAMFSTFFKYYTEFAYLAKCLIVTG